MPLDDTNWPAAAAGAPAENMRAAGGEQQTVPAGSVAVAPAGNNHVEVTPASNASRAGAGQTERAGGEQDRVGKEQDRAGALCPSSAGGEQTDRPAATETDETTALLIRARSYIARGWCIGMQGQ